MEKPKIPWGRVVGCGALLATFHFPLLAMGAMLPGPGAAALLAVSGALSFLALWSERMREVFLKELCAVPFSVLWLQLVGDFSVRMTNLQSPGYGRMSAGGGFGLFISGLLFFAGWLAAFLVALTTAGAGAERAETARRAVRRVVLPILAVAVLGAVLYLDASMPTWAEIWQAVYG